MNERLTFCIPVAPHHKSYLDAAIASVQAQTIPCRVIVSHDTLERGAGWARNQALLRVHTPYVSFLDADDWIEPTFVETCLSFIRPHTYVYTGWFKNNEPIPAPRDAWCDRPSWHCVTCVMATEDALDIGGFDETLPAHEDADFYMHLMSEGVCGIGINQSLFHYRVGSGQRAVSAARSGQLEILRQRIGAKWSEGKMGCCGETISNDLPVGTRQPNDVLAQALWGGNREQGGLATGRRYPRMSWPKLAWVAPEDITASPNLWKRVPPPVYANGQPNGVGRIGDAIAEIGRFQPIPSGIPSVVETTQEQPRPFEDVKADVLGMAGL